MLLGSSFLEAQTVKEVFPELESVSPEFRTKPLTSRFFKRAEADLSLTATVRWPEWLNPKSKDWILNREPEEFPDHKKGYVEVAFLSEKDFFVISRAPHIEQKPGGSGFQPYSGGGAEIYRVSPDLIEMVTTIQRGDGLFFTQVGVSRWAYEYFEDGRLKEQSAWRDWPSAVQYSKTTYAYWPDSEKFRSITVQGGMMNTTTIQHFDKEGTVVRLEKK